MTDEMLPPAWALDMAMAEVEVHEGELPAVERWYTGPEFQLIIDRAFRLADLANQAAVEATDDDA
jgi:hypothetical protein